MTEESAGKPAPARPALTAKAAADKQARIEREAAALRENLRRRKQQARVRTGAQRKPE